eukprot:8771454-Alexandrium_andersonii.AAC.1
MVNCDFEEPWHTALPTASVWSGLELSDSAKLWLSQTDVNNAFYRIINPPGLSEHFVLPRVQVRHLYSCGIQLPESLSGSQWASPVLCVLPMGVSWSLYICQAMVRQATIDAGVPAER